MSTLPLISFLWLRFGAFAFILLSFVLASATAQTKFEYVCDATGTGPVVTDARKGVAEVRYCGNDGGYIMAGQWTDMGVADDRIIVIRTNNDGSRLWGRTYDLGTSHDVGVSIKELPDGSGFIVAGDRGSGASSDIFLMRLECDGDVSWVKTYAIPSSPQENASDVIVAQSMTSGNAFDFVVSGSIQEQNQQRIDGYLLRTDAGGTVQWAAAYDFTVQTPTNTNEALNSLTEAAPTNMVGGGQQSVGDIISVGFYSDVAANQLDGFIIRVDGATGLIYPPANPLSNLMQDMAVYGTSETENLHAVIQLSEGQEAGNIAAVGISNSSYRAGMDIYMLKTSGDPAVPLVQSLIASASNDDIDIGNDLKEAHANYLQLGQGVYIGDLVITGATTEPVGSQRDAILLGVHISDLTPVAGSGNIYGDHASSDREEGFSLTEVVPHGTNAQGFAIAGTGGPFMDAYLVKTDVDGSTGCEEDWHPQGVNPTWSPDQTRDMVIILGPNVTNRSATTRKVEGTPLCDDGGEEGGGGIGIGKHSTEDALGAIDANTSGTLSLYPNPIKQGETFSFSLPDQGGEEIRLTVTNVVGEEVFNKTIGRVTEIDLGTERLPAGTYLVTARAGTRSYSTRVVIE